MQARPHTRWEETAGPTDNPVMHSAPEPAFVIRFRPEKGKPWNDQQVRQRALSRKSQSNRRAYVQVSVALHDEKSRLRVTTWPSSEKYTLQGPHLAAFNDLVLGLDADTIPKFGQNDT